MKSAETIDSKILCLNRAKWNPYLRADDVAIAILRLSIPSRIGGRAQPLHGRRISPSALLADSGSLRV